MFRELTQESELKQAFSLLKELRPHIEWGFFLEVYQNSQAQNDYKLLGYFDQEQLVGIMGYRILWDLVRGKHFYIDDLIILETYRSQGVGKKFMELAEQKARELSCSTIRLCTGTDNESAKKFYEREKMKSRTVVYTKKINQFN